MNYQESLISTRFILGSLKTCCSWAICLLILSSGQPLNGQSEYLDSLLVVLQQEKDEFELLRTNTRIGHYHQDNSDAQAISYYSQALDFAEKLDIPLRIANSHYNMAYSFRIKSDFDNALDHYLQSARIYEEIQDSFRLSNALMSVAAVYHEYQDYSKTADYHDRAQSIIEGVGDSFLLCELLNSRGVLSDKQEKFEEALEYFQNAFDLAVAIKSEGLTSYALSNMGLTYKRQGNSERALQIFTQVLDIFKKSDYPPDVFASVYNNIGSTLAQMKQYSKARDAFDTSIDFANKANAPSIRMEGYKKLAELSGKTRDFQNQAIFLQEYYGLKDSLFSIESKNTIVQLESDYQIEQKNSELLKQEAELSKQKSQRNLFLMISSSALALLLMLSFFYKRIRGTNNLLEDRNSKINEQNVELENTLSNLKSTQTQLIQSEKMASLGELTAGIAHEIQNPLNFVNNFSDVNTELIDELVTEITSTPLSEQNIAEAIELAGDIKANEEKIKHHGGRADSIVKGMLQHSRTSSGEKVPTDINALADEYLRLSYHGLRAKDNTFNATMETDFDVSIGKINVIPQDIGRVLLNMLNNAFYAVNDKLKSSSNDYQPKVILTTKNNVEEVAIIIEDNGGGIPKEMVDKIFQPFFTTKPTGQGTGLGLSLSYDIIKAHNGELLVESEPKKGSSFIIKLPIR